MQVNTLLTKADSFTPNASSPVKELQRWKRMSKRKIGGGGIKQEGDVSELLLTCQSEYDEDSEYVRVLGQDTRSVHAHVSPAEVLNVPSDQLIEGRAPRSGHTWSSCAEESITVKLNDMRRTTH